MEHTWEQVATGKNGEATVDERETIAPAKLLEASRRVDWRFLLPEPSLGRVLYVGPMEMALANSLQLFSDSLTFMEMDQTSDATDWFDVIVAHNPSRATLHRMVTQVRTGGFLYVEVHGLSSLLLSLGRSGRPDGFGKDGLWRPGAHVAALQQLGCTEVQLHWHWPDFENCKMMIPLANPAAVQHAFDRGGRSVKGRLRAAVGRGLHWSGLLAWTVPCFSVLARRSNS